MGIENLEYFFNPESVAVIGASSNPEKLGHSILRNFVENGFEGKIYPINPKGGRIFNLKVYPSVLDVKDDIDLGIIAVNPNISNEVVKECVEKGVKAIVIITAGYKEIGGTGIERERELERIIEGSETRVIGPNCLGIFNHNGVDTLFLPEYKLERPKKGKIAIIAQSGAFGSVIMDLASYNEIGISKFISYGNAVDVDEMDLLEFLKEDEETDCVLAYIEAIKNGDKFKKKMKEITREMPVVILKAGKSKKGSEAALSHTGSLASSYEIYKGILKQFGCIEANNVERMLDFGKALSFEKYAIGERVAVVTNGGGFGVLSTDVIERTGLNLIEFEKRTERKLRGVIPEYGRIHNPLDLIGDADPERYKKVLEILNKAKEVDAILIIALMQTSSMNSDILDVLIEFKEKSRKKFVVCMAGGNYTSLHAKNLEKVGIPVYPTPERATFALKALFDYGKYLKREKVI